MMLLHMMKKDLLLAKKYLLVTALTIIAIPLFVRGMVPTAPGIIIFLYMIIMGEMLLLQVISQEEGKNPKAAALLCAAPYPRNAFVKAKYILPLLIFAYSYIAYTLVMVLINPAKLLDLQQVLAALLFSVIMFGIYIPIELRYGFVKARYMFMIVIIMASMGPSIYVNLFPNFKIDISAFTAMPNIIQWFTLSAASIIILGISLMISIKTYAQKEL